MKSLSEVELAVKTHEITSRLDKHPPGTKAGRSPETKISRMCSDMSRGQSMLADSHGSNGPSTRQAKLNGWPSHSQGSQVRSTAWISNHTPWQPKEHFNTLYVNHQTTWKVVWGHSHLEKGWPISNKFTQGDHH